MKYSLTYTNPKKYSTRRIEYDIFWRKYWALRGFNIPATGVYYVPLDSITNWVITEPGGTPVASLESLDVGDDKISQRNHSTKKLRFTTGGHAPIQNVARYQFQAGESPVDFTDYHVLVWLYIEPGSGITDWTNIVQVQLFLQTASNEYFVYRLGIPPVEFALGGWYSFSFPCQGYTGFAGAPDLTNINYIGLYVQKNTNTSPIVDIGMIAIVPKASNIAELCIIADGWSASHKVMANLLTAQNMFCTLPWNGEPGGMIGSELKELENAGHQICCYCENWGDDPTDTYATVAILTNQKAELTGLGFTDGIRSFVHGNTSAKTEAQNNIIFPDLAANYSCAERTLTSPYHLTYISRYHELEGALLTDIIDELNVAVASNARMGLLIHQLDAVRMTAFETLLNDTLIPLVNAGTLRVITMKEAYINSLAL